jgi:hypothetical protein
LAPAAAVAVAAVVVVEAGGLSKSFLVMTDFWND